MTLTIQWLISCTTWIWPSNLGYCYIAIYLVSIKLSLAECKLITATSHLHKANFKAQAATTALGEAKLLNVNTHHSHYISIKLIDSFCSESEDHKIKLNQELVSLTLSMNSRIFKFNPDISALHNQHFEQLATIFVDHTEMQEINRNCVVHYTKMSSTDNSYHWKSWG